MGESSPIRWQFVLCLRRFELDVGKLDRLPLLTYVFGVCQVFQKRLFLRIYFLLNVFFVITMSSKSRIQMVFRRVNALYVVFSFFILWVNAPRTFLDHSDSFVFLFFLITAILSFSLFLLLGWKNTFQICISLTNFVHDQTILIKYYI